MFWTACLTAGNDGSMVEGSSPKQMLPKLDNKKFSEKSTQCMHLKRHKESYNTVLEIRIRGMQWLAS